MSASDLAAVTGLPEAEAQMYMEMAANDLEQAVALYFSMAGDNQMNDIPPPAPCSSAPDSPLTEALSILFGPSPSLSSLPIAWTDQPIAFSDPTFVKGIPQLKNGPCGVLAAVNALFVATDSTDLYSLLLECVTRCRPTPASPLLLATFPDDSLSSFTTVPFPATGGEASVVSYLTTRPLGLLMFVLSLIATRTPALVRQEAPLPGDTFQPLIFGPFSLCGTELINLILFGNATPSVSAYDHRTNAKVTPTPTPVGMLSYDSSRDKLPLADHFLNPTTDTYILHGGDHFTFMFKDSDSDSWMHYNGLPPNRKLTLCELNNATDAPPVAPAVHKATTYRQEIGEIESIVQAHPDDKAMPWRMRRFELCLVNEAIALEDAATPQRPADVAAPPKFVLETTPTQEARWRCVGCYSTRYKTMCFGENPPGCVVCKFCGAPPLNNHTIYVAFSDLPLATKRRIDAQESKVLTTLRTRWSAVEVEVAGKEMGSVEGCEAPVF